MMEARAMTVIVAPKPAVMQKVAQQRAAQEKARQLAEKEGRAPPPAPSSVEHCRTIRTTTTMTTTTTTTTTTTAAPTRSSN